MKIENVDQLWAVLPETFKAHVQEDDSQLPTATLDALWEEFNAATSVYADGGTEDNYVPAYHDCGLIARALSIAEKAGHELGSDFNGIPRY